MAHVETSIHVNERKNSNQTSTHVFGTQGFPDVDLEVTLVTLFKDTEDKKDKIKNCSREIKITIKEIPKQKITISRIYGLSWCV